MPIYKPSQLDFSNKKIKMIIYGVPSMGKSTLALSSPKPLLVDLDRGISRVEAIYRKDTLIAETFEVLKKDLKDSDLSSYETIIIDTGGALLELLKPYVIKMDAKNSTKSGDLALAGWGAIGREFKEFGEFVNGLGKHIIYVFHAVEDKEDDKARYRLSADGGTKNKIWEGIDLGGFLDMNGKERVINFSASERYFAKGNHQINGNYKVPVLKDGIANTFLTDLFAHYIDELNKSTKSLNEDKKAYDKAMTFVDIINGSENQEDINMAYAGLKKVKHALTSKVELFNILNQKANQLGLQFDKEKNSFELKDRG